MVLATSLLGFVLVVVLVYGSTQLWSTVSGAQLVSTPRAVLRNIVQLARLSRREQFVECGAGLGGVAAFVAQSTQAAVIGVDASPVWVALARCLHSKSRARFVVGNVYTTDLTRADVVYCYLLPPMLERLGQKFVAELKPGSRVITYGFPLPNRAPIQMIERTSSHGPLFLYKY